jgi:hypothetical protein
MNYFTRENGLWYVENEGIKVIAPSSSSMELAYQKGIMDACRLILSSTVQSIHQKLAESHLKECDKLFTELHEMNKDLEDTLNSQPKPSDALGI